MTAHPLFLAVLQKEIRIWSTYFVKKIVDSSSPVHSILVKILGWPNAKRWEDVRRYESEGGGLW